MRVGRWSAISFLAMLMVLAVSGIASAQGFGVKGGLVFANFSSDVLDFDNSIGWQGGVFFGSGGPVGVTSEVNIIRKRTVLSVLQDADVSLTYLQIPVLLRVSGGSNAARLYGIVGPAIDLKIGDSIEGVNFDTDDMFESYDISVIGGVGVQFAHILLEGRYTHGFRQINKFDFNNAAKINTRSFAVLAGVGF